MGRRSGHDGFGFSLGLFISIFVAALVVDEVMTSLTTEHPDTFEDTCFGLASSCSDAVVPDPLISTPPAEVFALIAVPTAAVILLVTAHARARRWWDRTPYGPRDVGDHAGVAVVDEDWRGDQPCIVCGELDADAETRIYRRDDVVFGVPVRRHDAGKNYYCQDCSDDGLQTLEVESWPAGYDRPDGLPAWTDRLRMAASAVAVVATATAVIAGVITVALAVPGGFLFVLPLLMLLVQPLTRDF